MTQTAQVALYVPFSLLLRSLFKLLLVVNYNSIFSDFSKWPDGLHGLMICRLLCVMFSCFIRLAYMQQNIQKCHKIDLFYS